MNFAKSVSLNLSAGGKVGGNLEIDGDLTVNGDSSGAYDEIINGHLDLADNNILNVGDISLDTISSDAGTSINVVLGSDSGDDFLVDTDKLVVEGDTGNIGVGTASPSDLLHLSASVPIIRLTDSDTSDYHRIYGSNGSLYFDADKGDSVASSKIAFGVDDTNAMNITASAVGIKAVPNTWNSLHTAVQLGYGAVAVRQNNNTTYLTNNLYYESSGSANPTYMHTNDASALMLSDGKLFFYNAPSGTQDATATLTKRLEIEADGTVVIAGALQPGGNVTVGGSHLQIDNGGVRVDRHGNPPYVMFEYDGTSVSQLRGIDGGGLNITNGAGGSNWMSISSTGNIGINETSPNAKLDVDGDIQVEGANALLLNHTTGGASDTYINSPESNKISFRTGGTERFYVDDNGTFVIKESTGDPDSTKLYLQSTKTYTDDEYENFDIAGRGAIVTVAVTTSGNMRSGLFFIDTASINVVKVADPSSDFANSDTDDKICVYKGSGNSNTFSVKNRKGGDRAISVGILATGA